MKRKKTVLIFGISSFLGSNLAESLKSEYKVIGTYHETIANIDSVLTVKCDVHNKDMVQKTVLLFQPDVTIYCVGLTDLNCCQDYPKVADALNTAGVFNVSNASERYNSKFIYFSSSYIFSGENILFKENDTPMPSSVYGNTIASSEFYIQKSCLNYIIFRCCPIIGRSYNANDLKWMEVIERCAFYNEKIVCDSKVYTGFLDIDTITEVLKNAIEQNITNRLFQVTSKDMMNRYDFTKKYLDIFDGNPSLASKGDWKFPRTENTIGLQNIGEELFFEMDVSNLESTFNITMPTVEESLIKLKKKYSGAISSKRKMKTSGVTFI